MREPGSAHAKVHINTCIHTIHMHTCPPPAAPSATHHAWLCTWRAGHTPTHAPRRCPGWPAIDRCRHAHGQDAACDRALLLCSQYSCPPSLAHHGIHMTTSVSHDCDDTRCVCGPPHGRARLQAQPPCIQLPTTWYYNPALSVRHAASQTHHGLPGVPLGVLIALPLDEEHGLALDHAAGQRTTANGTDAVP